MPNLVTDQAITPPPNPPESTHTPTCGYCGGPGPIVFTDQRNELDIPVCASCRNGPVPSSAQPFEQQARELVVKLGGNIVTAFTSENTARADAAQERAEAMVASFAQRVRAAALEDAARVADHYMLICPKCESQVETWDIVSAIRALTPPTTSLPADVEKLVKAGNNLYELVRHAVAVEAFTPGGSNEGWATKDAMPRWETACLPFTAAERKEDDNG